MNGYSTIFALLIWLIHVFFTTGAADSMHVATNWHHQMIYTSSTPRQMWAPSDVINHSLSYYSRHTNWHRQWFFTSQPHATTLRHIRHDYQLTWPNVWGAKASYLHGPRGHQLTWNVQRVTNDKSTAQVATSWDHRMLNESQLHSTRGHQLISNGQQVATSWHTWPPADIIEWSTSLNFMVHVATSWHGMLHKSQLHSTRGHQLTSSNGQRVANSWHTWPPAEIIECSMSHNSTAHEPPADIECSTSHNFIAHVATSWHHRMVNKSQFLGTHGLQRTSNVQRVKTPRPWWGHFELLAISG